MPGRYKLTVSVDADCMAYLDVMIAKQLWVSYSHAVRTLIMDHRERIGRHKRGRFLNRSGKVVMNVPAG